MILDTTNKPHRLTADEGKKLYDKTVELKEGEKRYLTDTVYLPDFFTIEDCIARFGEISEVGDEWTDLRQ